MFHWICPECGQEVEPTARECPVCEAREAAAKAPAPVAPAVAAAVQEPPGAIASAPPAALAVEQAPAAVTPVAATASNGHSKPSPAAVPAPTAPATGPSVNPDETPSRQASSAPASEPSQPAAPPSAVETPQIVQSAGEPAESPLAIDGNAIDRSLGAAQQAVPPQAVSAPAEGVSVASAVSTVPAVSASADLAAGVRQTVEHAAPPDAPAPSPVSVVAPRAVPRVAAPAEPAAAAPSVETKAKPPVEDQTPASVVSQTAHSAAAAEPSADVEENPSVPSRPDAVAPVAAVETAAPPQDSAQALVAGAWPEDAVALPASPEPPLVPALVPVLDPLAKSGESPAPEAVEDPVGVPEAVAGPATAVTAGATESVVSDSSTITFDHESDVSVENNSQEFVGDAPVSDAELVQQAIAEHDARSIDINYDITSSEPLPEVAAADTRDAAAVETDAVHHALQPVDTPLVEDSALPAAAEMASAPTEPLAEPLPDDVTPATVAEPVESVADGVAEAEEVFAEQHLATLVGGVQNEAKLFADAVAPESVTPLAEPAAETIAAVAVDAGTVNAVPAEELPTAEFPVPVTASSRTDSPEPAAVEALEASATSLAEPHAEAEPVQPVEAETVPQVEAETEPKPAAVPEPVETAGAAPEPEFPGDARSNQERPQDLLPLIDAVGADAVTPEVLPPYPEPRQTHPATPPPAFFETPPGPRGSEYGIDAEALSRNETLRIPTGLVFPQPGTGSPYAPPFQQPKFEQPRFSEPVPSSLEPDLPPQFRQDRMFAEPPFVKPPFIDMTPRQVYPEPETEPGVWGNEGAEAPETNIWRDTPAPQALSGAPVSGETGLLSPPVWQEQQKRPDTLRLPGTPQDSPAPPQQQSGWGENSEPYGSGGYGRPLAFGEAPSAMPEEPLPSIWRTEAEEAAALPKIWKEEPPVASSAPPVDPSLEARSMAGFQSQAASTLPLIRPKSPARKPAANEDGPRVTLPGPSLPPELVSVQAAGVAPDTSKKKKASTGKSGGMPGWLTSVLVAVLVLGAGLAGLFYFFPMNGTSAAGQDAKQEPVAAGTSVAANAAGSHPLSRYLELTGVRFVVDPKSKSSVQYLVVNHSGAEIADVTLHVTIRSAAKPSGPPLTAFSFRLPALAAYESKEMSSSIERLPRGFEVPDWQNLKVEFQITAP